MRKTLALALAATMLSACATVEKSTLLGGAIGGAVGAGIGQHSSQNSQGTMIGLAVGAGLGSLIGYLSHKGKQSKAVKSEENGDDLLPLLTKPKIRSIVVPDSIEGNKYIKSHRVFILEDAGSWSKD